MNRTEMSQRSAGYHNGSSYRRENKGMSGAGYDRWVERNSMVHSTALGKVQKQFWFTKSALLRKLGKNQDEHVVASDAELDAKMELFKAIESSTKELQVLLAEYQSKICTLAQEENAMGRLLKDWGHQDKGTANQVMTATGKSISYTAQQRLALRAPLVRLFQEVDTFQTRAIEDTGHTLSQMEKMRTEYRGALMWMKNISQDFNPDQYSQLEKFRQVQEIVRHKKAKFDALKIKSIQKIDLLAASRCNMFSHALILYQNAIINFSVKTAKTLNSVASTFQGYQHYNFQVIKELAEPDALRNISEGSRKIDKDEKMFFDAEYHDEDDNSQTMNAQKVCPRHGPFTSNQDDKSKSDSLMNLYEELSDGKKSEMSAEDDQASARKHNVDLLTNNADVPDTEKDTQQMLKDLFDSPHRQALPPVYGAELDSTISSSEQVQQPNSQSSSESAGKMFMPSQLLDYGLLDWGQGVATGPQLTASTQDGIMSSGAGAMRAPDTASSGQLPSSDTFRDASASKGSKGGGAADSKVDWYKVFQDIDPLSDPASDYFQKKEDGDDEC